MALTSEKGHAEPPENPDSLHDRMVLLRSSVRQACDRADEALARAEVTLERVRVFVRRYSRYDAR
jgi:hypothetical protein